MADIISRKLGLSKRTGRRFLQEALDMIADDIVYTGKSEFRRFGKFHVTTKPAQTVKHPETGEIIHIPEKNIVQFKTSEVIRRRLNPEK
ncbi:MAG: HU family DNA-binding protein [Nitrospirota bacterium]